MGDAIDLTMDTDDDDGGPLPGLAPPAKPPRVPRPLSSAKPRPRPRPLAIASSASRPLPPPVPLPGSSQTPAPSSKPIRSVLKPAPPRNASSVLPGNSHASPTQLASSSRPASANPPRPVTGVNQNNGRGGQYVPVFAGPLKGTFGARGNDQAEKRRKLSSTTPGHQMPASRISSSTSANSSRRGSSNGDVALGAPRTSLGKTPNGNTGVKLNNGPTVTLPQYDVKGERDQDTVSQTMFRANQEHFISGRSADEIDQAGSGLTAGPMKGFGSSSMKAVEENMPAPSKTAKPTAASAGRPTFPSSSQSFPVPASRPGPKAQHQIVRGTITSPAYGSRESISESPFHVVDEHMTARMTMAPNMAGTSTATKAQTPTGTPAPANFSAMPTAPKMAPTITVAPLTANDAASANLGATNKKHGNQFLTEEDHLLIYLKEVKKVKWRDIEAYFPGRKWHALQSRYSTKLNKRDRAQDPPTFTLPAQFANEALTDANAVQQDTTGAIQTLTMDAATVFQALPQSLPRTSRALPIATAAPEPPPVEDSSANESGPARRRPRRVEHAPNFYTWPRRNGLAHAVDDIVGAEIDSPEPETMSDASVETPPIPDKAIPVENDPMAVDFDEENAAIALATERCNRSTASGQKLPYLSSSQRLLSKNTSKDWEWEQLDSREWQGYVVHVDFSPTEMVLVELVMAKVLGVRSLARSTQRRFLQKSLKTLTEPKLVQLSHEIRRRLPARDQNDVDAFVEDARQGKLHENPRVERIGAARPGRHFSSDPKTSISARLRQREVGLCSRRGWAASSRPITYQLQNNLQDSLGPAYSYTGASSDVHTVAWSPDGQCFAAGAVCVTDPHSMQYNRRNNLLYGDISTNTMHELGEHYLDREKTETGPNSTHAMHISQDPKLYTTISSVAFSPDGRFMFSAGYDSTACVWKTSPDGQPGFLRALKHKAEVDMLTVSCEGKLATAAKKWTTNAVKVLTMNEDDPSNVQKQNYTSQKAGQRPDLNILPTALQFEPRYGRLLLAGFGANQCTDRLDTNGDICLWDVETTQQLSVHGSGKNVFDVAWNPYQRVQPLFMIGCVAGQNVNRGTRSLLRFYDGYGFGKYSMNMEIECKALDMNDIIFCPHDETLVAAGCTNGRAYVWDIRRPDQLLCELAHGKSLMPLDDFVDREITDTGIRFLSWGTNATRLYSGSSDGVVKVWDVVRSEKDVFIKDLITTDSGIMSGAFSPDYSRLILGEVNGSINVLEVGREDYSIRDMNKFKYCPYQDPDEDQTEIEATISADSGKAAAIALLADSKMMQVPMGGLPIFQAVQGPNYDGPYDQSVDAPFLREQALEFQHNLSVSSGPQCDIAACRDVVKVTAEEIGDSGRSTDRIPDELRKQFMALGSGVAVLPPGKSKCTRCGRPARPAFDSVATMLCERCSFTCFRCGASNPVMPDTAIFACQSCERIWDIGVLGYECVQESRKPMDIATDVPSLRAPSKKKNALDDNVSFGDELNAFTDYYFSLAIDRPLSPPL